MITFNFLTPVWMIFGLFSIDNFLDLFFVFFYNEKYTKLNREKQSLLRSCVICFFYSITVLFNVFLYLNLNYNITYEKKLLSEVNRPTKFFGNICLSYSIYDLIRIFIYNNKVVNKDFLPIFIHHLFVSFMWYAGHSGQLLYYGYIEFLTEISTIFLCMLQFCQTMISRKSKLLTFSGVGLWITFGFMRIPVTLYVFFNVIYDVNLAFKNNYNFIQNWYVFYVQLFGMTFLNIVNFYWYSKITRGFIKLIYLKNDSAK